MENQDNPLKSLLQFQHIVEPLTEIAKSFPLDGHEPDCAGWKTNVKIEGIILDNAGFDKEIKITLSKQDGEKFQVRLTDLIAFAIHGFKQAKIDFPLSVVQV